MIVNSSRGGGSKDTWVLENGEDHTDRVPTQHPESLPPALPDLRYGAWTGQDQQQQQQRHALMLARIAHELFWLGRNLARAEHTRGCSTASSRPSCRVDPRAAARRTLSWDSAACTIMGGRRERDVADDRDAVLDALTRDPDNPASVVACVARAREGARTVRDVISRRDVGGDQHDAPRLRDARRPHAAAPAARTAIYQHVKERSALFWGLTARTMLRDEASAFLNAGGRIEAGDMVLRMLRVALPINPDEAPTADGQAIALLQAVGGFQAYRRAVPAPPHAKPVARFLLFERNYPDSRRGRGRRRQRVAAQRPTPTRAAPSRSCA